MGSLEGFKSSLLSTVTEQCNQFDRVLEERLAKRRLIEGFIAFCDPQYQTAKFFSQLKRNMH